jgi:hypothetical protein
MVRKSPSSRRSRFGLMASVLVTSSVFLLLPTACGSGDEDDSANGNCPSCGNSCDATNDCPTGQFCAPSDTCQRECEPGTDDPACGSGDTCSENGECVADDSIELGMGGEGGMSGGDGDGDGDAGCIEVDVTFEPQIPNVVLLVDQSGSMHDDSGDFKDNVQAAIVAGDYTPWDCPDSPNGNSPEDGWDNDSDVDSHWRWNVVRNVLLHPDRGVVKPLEDKVRFGLSLYSSDNGDLDGATCPNLREVDLKFGNHADMLAEFKCSDLLRDTPTRESLTETAEKLAALDVDGPKVIVLATDGAPDTCACANWDASDGRPESCRQNLSTNDVEYEGEMLNTSEYEQVLVTLEAKRIYEELGIRIEVINVGDSSIQGHLNSVAVAGGATSGSAIVGTSPGALIDAFQSIIDGVRSCAVDLDGNIAAGKEDSGTVTLDGDKLKYNGANGWKVNSPTQIELVGDACTTIKTGDHDLGIEFPCGSFVAIPK